MKKQNLKLLTLSVIFASSTAFAEVEVTGELIYENASFTESGTSTGDEKSHGNQSFKNQLEVKVFVDGEIDDYNSYHVELKAFRDGKAVDDYDENEQYTQRDFLREAYIDSDVGNWSIRTGKQQVVWGTADGIKLLDLINPTDYSEVNQNSPEDARISTWMINAETDLENGGNFQAIVSQPRENIFAGLNRDIDTSVRANGQANFRGIPDVIGQGHNQGHAFIFKGVDTITGAKNGFLNIAPDLGSVAAGFGAGFVPLFDPLTREVITQGEGGVSGLNNIDPRYTDPNLGVIDGNNAQDRFNAILTNFTVGAFTSGFTLAQLDGGFRQAQVDNSLVGDTNSDDNIDAQDALGFADTYFGVNVANQACQDIRYNPGFGDGTAPHMGAGTNENCQNLFSQFDPSTGEITGSQAVVASATNAIFNDNSNAFTGEAVLNGFGAQYASNLSSFGDGKRDSAFEYMTGASFRTFDTFVNAKSQYIFDMPDNADANLAFRWKDNTEKGLNYSLNYSYNYDTNPVIDLSWRNDMGEILTKSVVDVTTTIATPGGNQVLEGQHIELTDSQNRQYGGSYATNTYNASAILTFEQTLERAHNIGASLDYALDTKALGPVVLRAEGLYQKDVYSPIIDLDLLSIGDLTDALVMTPGDRFKYVLGVDITVFTNMLVSTQFIQDRNLDFIDSGNKYTADFASMHLTNGLLKAEKNKNFVSLFLSKPFGSNQEHRWNNIIIFEDQGDGGYWNRLDMEYSINDDFQFTAEYNRYWGEENSQFGQLADSSNVQVGVKYSF